MIIFLNTLNNSAFISLTSSNGYGAFREKNNLETTLFLYLYIYFFQNSFFKKHILLSNNLFITLFVSLMKKHGILLSEKLFTLIGRVLLPLKSWALSYVPH